MLLDLETVHPEEPTQLPKKKRKDKGVTVSTRAKKKSRSTSSNLELAVCPICGCTPCEWVQFGLTVVNLMMQAFDHEKRSPDGLLIDPNTNVPLDNPSVRRVAYKCFQYEKYGTIAGTKSLSIPKCVVGQTKYLYP